MKDATIEYGAFLRDFSALFEETPVENLDRDTPFRNIEEWSSLIALGFIALCDEKYGVKVSGEQIRLAVTIDDLYRSILGQ